MTSTTNKLHSLPCYVLGAAVLCASPAVWADAANQFQQWNSDRWVNRTISLSELGLTSPAVFDGASVVREFYLPVPSDIPLDNATMQLNGQYLRVDGGRTSMTVSIDGYPVAAHRFTEDQGAIRQAIGIDGLPRNSGFVRFGVNWSSFISEQVCTDNRTPGNSLRINNDSSFSYRFDRNAIKTLASAWSALPNHPVILTGKTLSFPAYDTAWRTGASLQKFGKKIQFKSLPAIGDTIDVSGINIPADLNTIPAFSHLGSATKEYVIRDLADIGALIALGDKGPLRADILITDADMLSQMRDATSALKAQIDANASAAATAYTTWIAQSFTALNDQQTGGQIRLAKFGGAPVISVPSNIGDKADGLFQTLWKPTAVSAALTVDKASTPAIDSELILLTRLGQFNAITGTIDVLSRADRSVSFDLGSVATDGRLPSEIVFDLSAAPNINGTQPIATVYFNDYLLGARQLTADGKPQRLSVDIPAYTLSARNEIRISFLRQPTQERCHDLPIAYPVSILPGSHLRLAKQSLGADFVGVAGKYADKSVLLVPDLWLTQPASSLPQVISIANATGFPTQHSTLKVIKTNDIAKPDSSFLAFDVLFEVQPGASIRQGKLVINNNSHTPLLDITGIDRIATVEVQKIAGETGIVYRNAGTQPPKTIEGFRLTQGDMAVIGDAGVLLQMDKSDPNGAQLAAKSNPQSVWQRYMTVWLVLLALLLLVFITARIAHVRNRKKNPDNH